MAFRIAQSVKELRYVINMRAFFAKYRFGSKNLSFFQSLQIGAVKSYV